MFEIVAADFLAPDVKQFRIRAPRIARRQRPGQFVIIRVNETGERIPLTIASSEPADGTITLVVQGVGKTTRLMNALEVGDGLQDVAGPLGKPSEIESFGTAVVVGGGVGTAIAWPTARALKEAGNEVIAIVGARNKQLLILEAEMRAASSTLHLLTDDGSYGERGFVTARLKQLYESGLRPGLVLAIGPVPMMRAVAELTRPFGTRTIVSLNAIMVDGTGMCGGCRVIAGGESKFACVDGPEFDAHTVDFDVLSQRNAMYKEAERRSLELYEQSTCAARKAEEAANCEARA